MEVRRWKDDQTEHRKREVKVRFECVAEDVCFLGFWDFGILAPATLSPSSLPTSTLTLYSTTHTKMLSGMRKKFMMVERASSGMYCDRIFMMDGQKMPTHASKTQKPRSWSWPPAVRPPPSAATGSKKYWEEEEDWASGEALVVCWDVAYELNA